MGARDCHDSEVGFHIPLSPQWIMSLHVTFLSNSSSRCAIRFVLLLYPLTRNFEVLASVAIFLYDYLLTLTGEITMIWPSRRSLGKIFFLVARYSVFFDIAIAFAWNVHDSIAYYVPTCIVFRTVSQLLALIGIIASEGAGKRCRILTWSFFAACCCSAMALLFLMFHSYTEPFEDDCRSRLDPPNQAIYELACYSVLLLAKVGFTSVAILSRLRQHRGSRNQLVVILYRDGGIYYVAMLTFTILNIVTNQAYKACSQLHHWRKTYLRSPGTARNCFLPAKIHALSASKSTVTRHETKIRGNLWQHLPQRGRNVDLSIYDTAIWSGISIGGWRG
ncbi:hypothetical protein CC2G_014195 [Coprinopsis cinerea AmutBmut pab1-1]|nr:hypothetical protein CC2G_014195 [Coprinopsis cinerea AmutBmut pab1-1]